MLNLKTLVRSRKNSNKAKKAFTLIELSIVLIIIGLLVAGVVGGAGLIKSSQLRSVITEVGGYNVAVNAFQTQFSQLPGDLKSPLTKTIRNDADSADLVVGVGGDEDGKIYFVDQHSSSAEAIIEGQNAWWQLMSSNIVDEELVPTVETGTFNLSYTAVDATDALVGGTHIPASRTEGVSWIFDYAATTTGGDEANVLIATNGVAITTVSNPAAIPPVSGNAQVQNAFTPSDALSIDAKIDDGKPLLGDVRVSPVNEVNCEAVGSYLANISTLECALQFVIGIK
jgi:prepilin-type N-terminal cleavage/methylation domain-containing protein